MREQIIFNGEDIISSPTSKKVKPKEVKEIKVKDNSRKIASLQKQIEKMQNS
jgi:hypothetical protein